MVLNANLIECELELVSVISVSSCSTAAFFHFYIASSVKNSFRQVCALFVISCVLCWTARAADRPNILFIMSDDHAYQAISAYDGKLNRTPNIDRIANEGMRFDRCYVTNSLCGPSRACILTGKYSHKNGFYDNTSQKPFDGS